MFELIFVHKEELVIFSLFIFLHLIVFRVWKSAGVCTHILEGHSGAITSVSIVNPEGAVTIKTFGLWTIFSKIKFTNPFLIFFVLFFFSREKEENYLWF